MSIENKSKCYMHKLANQLIVNCHLIGLPGIVCCGGYRTGRPDRFGTASEERGSRRRAPPGSLSSTVHRSHGILMVR